MNPRYDGIADEKESSTFITYSGIKYRPFAPRVEDVYIEDIAHALAHQCRYAGHIEHFYSVAEHSVYVSRLCPQKFMLEGLLHDAAEAYCQDLIAPIKKFLPGYNRMIERNEVTVRQAFGLPMEETHSVVFIDSLLGKWERTMLTKHFDRDYVTKEKQEIADLWVNYWNGEVPYTKRLPIFQCLPPAEAKAEFLRMFGLLTYNQKEAANG